MTARSCSHCNAALEDSDEGMHHYVCPEHGAVDPQMMLVGKHPVPLHGTVDYLDPEQRRQTEDEWGIGGATVDVYLDGADEEE